MGINTFNHVNTQEEFLKSGLEKFRFLTAEYNEQTEVTYTIFKQWHLTTI